MPDDLLSLLEGRIAEPHPGLDQFRLIRIQTFNWGTFSGVTDIAVPAAGFLIVGPSGSGKSTLLDAHTALLTPPRWVDFNVAARETDRRGLDRNLITYLRGAWAHQTGDSGENVLQYLRQGTTWSALAETYRDGHGKHVVLAQVLWVRGKSSVTGDVRKQYLLFERPFDVRELEFFSAAEFDVRRLKARLPDAFVHDEFSAYQERFRRLLGIESERALRLLHKTQSAKNLGDLNSFLREFMLDAPETFAVAQRLVAEFGELNEAHQAVVTARSQIAALVPARDEYDELQTCERERSDLDEVALGVDPYREEQRKRLLQAAIGALRVAADGAAQEASRLATLEAQALAALRTLQDQRQGMGGGKLEELAARIDQAERDRPIVAGRRDRAAQSATSMGWVLPDNPAEFADLTERARQRVLLAGELARNLEERRDDIKDRLKAATGRFQAARVEIEAMERQRSNIPARMLDAREVMATAIGIAPDRLPFAGELIEVRADEQPWQGAIERVLGGFAQSLLVDDKHYAAVSGYLNDTFTGVRLVYLRVRPGLPSHASAGPNSLVRKLAIAPGPYADWLREELKARFDYECATSISAFRNAPRAAVTREGQIRHNATRHEKDDRTRVDDRRQWVLGFDNKAKLALFKEQAQLLAEEVAALEQAKRQADGEGEAQRTQAMDCQRLADLMWADIDVASLVAQIADIQQQVRLLREASPELAAIDRAIGAQQQESQLASGRKHAADAALSGIEVRLQAHRQKLDRLHSEASPVALTALQRRQLDERFARAAQKIELETLDQATLQVDRGIATERRELALAATELRNAIEQRFAAFIRTWPAEAGGLDARLESAPDFLAKLTRLETDGLPKFEERFRRLLREQSDQNLTLLATKIDLERKAIRDRMELVNESLEGAAFNRGTYLVIESRDKTNDEVRSFKQSVKDALSQSFSADAEVAERRFEVLRALVKRLASQEPADKSWRALVLDVRQHVEFVARELDESGLEIEIYQSGDGKSGGQRQKLAATCLAAALRYQLGGRDRTLPSFSTVMLDEAFDKADAEFTTMAMNIFKTFGFQMVVATPLKSVMTLEPFIGGACFVHIKERKNSTVLMIEYDENTQRLNFPESVADEQDAAVS
jgi:uncharacterized protein YPO0396